MDGSLVETQGCYHGEFRHHNFKLHTVNDTFHLIGPNHLTNPGFKITSGNILMILAWLKHGLLSHHAFAFYFPGSEAGIINMPMAPQQLDCEFALIFNGNAVGKHIVKLAGARV